METKTESVLPQMLRGSVHQQFKKCGKSNCKCTRGELHGAYYHFVRIGGKLKKRYLKAREVQKVLLACITRRNIEKQYRANECAGWRNLRELRAEIREHTHHVKY